MDPWIASGFFLLGAGVGSLASAVLHAKQIRKLKDLLEAAATIPQQKNKATNRTSASPPSPRSR